jgi:hypothetical protein
MPVLNSQSLSSHSIHIIYSLTGPHQSLNPQTAKSEACLSCGTSDGALQLTLSTETQMRTILAMSLN